jgi:CheY-like chemotaxis protein/anti-sigma regulatory factor (Ser/Thr protein kinase)
MNAIIGIVQIGLQKKDMPEEILDAFDKIYISSNNLLGIINDILDFSKIETGKLELSPYVYDIPSLINDAVQINIVRIDAKEIEFSIDADSNLPAKLFGDELRLKQILNNLLSNAIKYTDKGYVKLSISHETEGDDVILQFIVEDTGYGMKEEDLETLFSEYQRFDHQANRAIEGTGLGLSITKKLIKMMNGKIEVKSKYGEGSTFTVKVKQKSVECESIGEEVSQKLRNFSFSTSRRDRRQAVREIMPYGNVLVVDDVETNLYVAKGLLAPYKLNVETALSGFEVIDLIKAGKEYDIIFMDHMMPKMDGIETTQKIRALGYKGTIVAFTANALTGNDEMFKKHGFDDFISKPIESRLLDAVLIKFIRNRHPEEVRKHMPETIANNSMTFKTNPKLLEIFKREAEKAIIKLKETAASGDIRLFTITIHAMKSALANIGENKMSQAAGVLENAGIDGDSNFINANNESFIKSLEELVKFMPPPDEISDEEDAGILEDTTYLIEQMNAIKAACEDYDDVKAYAALDLLKEKPWKKKTFAALEDIRDTLFLHSNFDQAADKALSFVKSLS